MSDFTADEESDPDFVNNAPFRYEKPSKKRKAESSNDVGRKGKRRKDVPLKPRGRAVVKRPRRLASSQNPLLAYFGRDIEFSLLSSEDESDRVGTPSEDDEDDGSADVTESDDDDKQSVKLSRSNSTAASMSPSKLSQLNGRLTSKTTSFTSQIQTNNISIPPKSLTGNADDGSATEPESDEDIPLFPSVSTLPQSHLKRQKSRESVGSVTEPESESEDFGDYTISSKPAFPIPEGRNRMGPLILDGDTLVPGYINTFLREYQREGVRFFYDRWKEGRGAILGDDMGLVCRSLNLVDYMLNVSEILFRVISFLSAIMKKHGDERDIGRRHKHVSRLQDAEDWRTNLPPANETWPTCLIVAPSSVVHNWARELDVWGYFEVGVYTGVPDERSEVLNEFKMGRLDIILTSFDTARRDILLLEDLAWSCIFVDEAHKIKNPSSQITIAYNQFTCQIRFGLTGTAIQNSYIELWTLLDWSSPGSLGTEKQWKTCIAKPLEVGQSSSATLEERSTAKVVAKVLVEKILPNFFLRRTKDLIRNQLPQKIDQVVFCPMTAMQIEVYKRILETEDVQDMIRKNELCECGSRKRRGECHHEVKAGSVFRYLSVLINISNHLALILPSRHDNEEQTKRNRALSEIVFRGEPIPKYGTSMLLPEFCGKWTVLNVMLVEWRKDSTNKVLIFTKSVKLLEMLDYHLNANSFRFCRLDGSTKQSERMPMIDEFNNDPDVYVFLISTLAGGTGLNLTGANRVVIFDPNWNPAHDLQAMDRAYRFGQRRDVYVYRLLGAGSIEELIYARQVYKQQQMRIGYEASNQTRYFAGVQGDTGKQGELFGLKNIFKLHEDTLATKTAIEKAQVAEFDWALTYMGGRSTKKSGSVANKDADDLALIDGEAKAVKDESELRGLGSLLFDDTVPDADLSQPGDNAQDVLAIAGIQYTHVNDSILRSSTVEKESWKAIVKSTKRQKSTNSSRANRRSGSTVNQNFEEEEPQWPPKRKHHKKPLSPASRLRSRQEALVHRGSIRSEVDLPEFATKFAELSHTDQQNFIRDLDIYARKHFGPL